MTPTLALALLFACGSEPAPAPPPAAEPAPVPAVEIAAAAANPDAPRVPTRAEGRLAASHILVAYAQSMKASSTVSRTREEARALAERLREQAAAPGADFAALAKEHSDDPSASRGASSAPSTVARWWWNSRMRSGGAP